jgi:hypothetical protein
MTIESARPDGADGLNAYRDVLEQVETLTKAGDYEAGIALLQPIARASGSEELMRCLIELRVEAFPAMADKILLEPMYEANELLGNTAALVILSLRSG